MLRTGLILLVTLTAALGAETLAIQLRDGKKRTVTPLRFDDDGLTVKYGADEVVYAWEDLKPASAFRARDSLTPYDDGSARLGLAEFALRFDLFESAQAEYEVAQALGALDEAAYEKRMASLKKTELRYYKTRIDRLVKRKADPRETLEMIKRFKERYPGDPAVAAYDAQVDALVEKLAK
ncbi:MAG: hypothetical protein OER88_03545, partial [Planctomycetota bacterium]|nr:hypothetical protein [Planctomycetota bacterium]